MRRRRMCCAEGCNHRFTTYEKEEDIALQVKKKDGTFQPFSRTKVVKAMQVACIKRPVSLNDIESVVARIERQIQDVGERIIDSQVIGDMVMEHLKKIDQVAYVRFASIYKDFKDPDAFRAELEGLIC